MVATVTLTATAEPDAVTPRVRLNVTVTGTPAVTSIVITRRDANGQSYPVRTSDAGPLPVSGGVATIYDYEVPFGQTATYSTNQPNGPAASVLLDVPDLWLIHIGVPSRSVRLAAVSSLGTRSRAANRGLFQVLERPDPVPVTSGARSTPSGVLGVRTRTDAERVALDLLLDDSSPVLLNVPVGKGWGVDTCYLSIGDTDETRTVPWGPFPYREWPLPYQVIGRPGGGTQAALTWNDVAAKYPTWQSIVDAGITSWAELAAPTG